MAYDFSMETDQARMDAACFGNGEKALVMIPGLGDGLKTVRGMGILLSMTYRLWGERFRVLVPSRREPVPEGASTLDMARDVLYAMEKQKISRAHVVGISLGGMIAQHLAALAPERVDRLVLCVSAPGPNPILRETISRWLRMGEEGRFRDLMADAGQTLYTTRRGQNVAALGAYVERVVGESGRERFCRQARACLLHDVRESLHRIHSPTLVLGGELDRVVGPQASRELAQGIARSVLEIKAQQGHGLYEEDGDFIPRVLRFLTE